MHETTKSMPRRLADSRFLRRYFVGDGIDIGSGPDPLMLHQEFFPLMRSCRAWDVPDGDAQEMAGVPDASYDFVHASHVLEHLPDPETAIHHWLRILKPGGHLVILVPEEAMYEKGQWPSPNNPDHKTAWAVMPDNAPAHVVGVLGLLTRCPGVEWLKVERLDATFHEWWPEQVDQTAHPNSVAECAIEIIGRKR